MNTAVIAIGIHKGGVDNTATIHSLEMYEAGELHLPIGTREEKRLRRPG